MAAIFISHSSRDNDQANKIKALLKADGYEQTFLDFDKHTGLRAGEDWERRLYEEIQRCHAVLLILTPNWLDSKWCFAEFTQARALGKTLFPLVLTQLGDRRVAPEIQGIDLKDWDADGEAYLRRRIKEVVAEFARGFAWDQTRPPYPGINSFDQDDAAIFFGRDREIREVLERLEGRRIQGGKRFVLILGNSGSGKSSLLKAGIVPQLGRDKKTWIVLPVFRPERDPIANFAKSLATFCGKPASWTDWQQALLDRDTRGGIVRIADELRVGDAAGATIVVSMDQFEETYTVATPEKREAFLRILSIIADGSQNLPYLLVGTARSDVFADILKQREFVLPLDDYPLQPIAMASLKSTIEGPAGVAAVNIERDLPERILADVRSSEALPLLAFALRELYERNRQARGLSIRAYEALGDAKSNLNPIENAVRRKAEDVLETLGPSASELDALKQAFVPHLVRIRDDGTLVRQPALRAELPAGAARLLDAFVNARLLTMRNENGSPDSVIEVSHEALFKAWPLLQSWLISERDFLAGRSELFRLYVTWQGAPADDRDDALLQGLALRRALDWRETRREGFSRGELEFIDASRRAWRIKNAKRVAAVSVSLLLLAIVLGRPIHDEIVRRTALKCDLYAAEPINDVHVPGVETDKIKAEVAIPECLQAVQQQPDNPRLIHNLARALESAGNATVAVTWYEKAAQSGFAASQNSLGVMLMTGKGTELDFSRGMALIRTAKSSGNSDAAKNYATDIKSIFDDRPVMVKALQRSLGLPDNQVTGTWTPATQSAVTKFKESKGITQEGVTPEVIDLLGAVDQIATAMREELEARKRRQLPK